MASNEPAADVDMRSFVESAFAERLASLSVSKLSVGIAALTELRVDMLMVDRHMTIIECKSTTRWVDVPPAVALISSLAAAHDVGKASPDWTIVASHGPMAAGSVRAGLRHALRTERIPVPGEPHLPVIGNRDWWADVRQRSLMRHSDSAIPQLIRVVIHGDFAARRRSSLLRIIDVCIAFLRRLLALVMCALIRMTRVCAFPFLVLAASRRYGRRSEPGDHVFPGNSSARKFRGSYLGA